MKITDNGIPAGYHVEIDNVDKTLWSELLMQFDDASFCQTWSYAAVLYGEKNLSHLILKKDGDVIAMAQVGIKKVSSLCTGANIHWGPLWRKKDSTLNLNNFSQMISALKSEYAINRCLLLRMWPNEIDNPENKVRSILEDAGFIYNLAVPQSRTLRLCLIPTLKELRQNLSRKWRQHLRRAEKFSLLDFEYGSSEKHYRIALNIYKEMYDRKQFSTSVDMEKQGLVQKDIPESLKMKILICRLKGEPIAALGWSTIGDTGLSLIAATGDKSLSTYASNLLWWKMIEDMKKRGCTFCDVGGIDPGLNPGGYQFKKGLVGKTGKDEKHIGQFVLYNNLRSHLLYILINKTRLIREELFAHRK